MSDNNAYIAAKAQITRAFGEVKTVVEQVNALKIPDAMLYDVVFPRDDAEAMKADLKNTNAKLMKAFEKVYAQIEKAENAVLNIRNKNLHRSYFDDLAIHETELGIEQLGLMYDNALGQLQGMLALLENRIIEDMHARILNGRLQSQRKADARRCLTERRKPEEVETSLSTRSQGETAILRQSNVWFSNQPFADGDTTPRRCPDGMPNVSPLIDYVDVNNSQDLQSVDNNQGAANREPIYQHMDNTNNAGNGLNKDQDRRQHGMQVRSDSFRTAIDVSPFGSVPMSVNPRAMPPVHGGSMLSVHHENANARGNANAILQGGDSRAMRSLANDLSTVNMPREMPRFVENAMGSNTFRALPPVNAPPQNYVQYGNQDVRADKISTSSYRRNFNDAPMGGRIERNIVRNNNYGLFDVTGLQERNEASVAMPNRVAQHDDYLSMQTPPGRNYYAQQQPIPSMQHAPVNASLIPTVANGMSVQNPVSHTAHTVLNYATPASNANASSLPTNMPIHQNQATTPVTSQMSATMGIEAMMSYMDNKSRMPTITLSVFDGTPDKFKAWWSTFMFTVDNNKSMSKGEKIHHLKNNLSGEAADMLEFIMPLEENYDKCVEMLKSRYDQGMSARQEIYERLNAMPQCFNDTKEIRQTFTKVKSGFMCLKDYESCDASTPLCDTIMRKFPEKIQKRMGKDKHNLGDAWTITAVLDKLDLFIKQEEAVAKRNPAPVMTLVTHTPDAYQRGRTMSRNSTYDGHRTREQSAAVSNDKYGTKNASSIPPILKQHACGLCDKDNHHAVNCRVIQSPEEKRKIVADRKLCYGCLSANHFSRECTAERCIECGRMHHVSLCMQKSQVRNASAGRSPFNNNMRYQSKSPMRDNYSQERGRNMGQDRSSFRSASRTTTST